MILIAVITSVSGVMICLSRFILIVFVFVTVVGCTISARLDFVDTFQFEQKDRLREDRVSYLYSRARAYIVDMRRGSIVVVLFKNEIIC